MPASGPLASLLGRVLLWLPVTFAVWYLTATWHLAPVAWLAHHLLQFWLPEAVADLRLYEGKLLLISRFGEVGGQLVANPPPGENLGFLTNPLSYSYSLPLFAALALATPLPGRARRLAIGLGVLLLIELSSMLATQVKTLVFATGGAFIAQQQWGAQARDAVALAYQLGSLLLPMVMPLVVWMAGHGAYLAQLAPALRRTGNP
ncbi:MAG: exosortase H-associated membrane protein [Porticoccaceae bacterium]